MWLTSSGIIRYDPSRGKMKSRTKWWCVVDVDREITRYCRYWVQKEYWIKLHQPSWNAHISVIRGEKPEQHLMPLWRKYHGKKIEFQYNLNVRKSGDTTNSNRSGYYWFVDVNCPFLLDIRKELNRPCNWPLHLTIGRTYW